MKFVEHEADLCVVGGGLAGTCAAVAAARRGIRVVLMQDRPVLGGNASGEIRMWVCGAHGDNNRETGIIEEMELENFYRNTGLSYSVWDSVVYEKAMMEPNLTLLLNCTCQEAMMEGRRIAAVKGWQMTSETYHTVRAALFADCSGDSILAPLTGAEFRLGRESRAEFGEPIAPELADRRTMGNSCLFQIRETDRPQPFIPPEWAYVFPTDDDMPFREHHIGTNYWWIELGGDRDSIHDADALRHELLRIALGVWDHVKNRGDHGADNWVLDWIGFLPGKRESRRYVGDVIITQQDVEAGGPFQDIVAYGGWTMDDHFPAGFGHKESYPTIHHPAPSPWGIPWRSLYSVNIENLAFAGRNISVTHTALSSSRVMATCALLGQAVGTGAALAVKTGATLRGLDVRKLQQMLMEDDCFLPGLRRTPSSLTLKARTNAEALRSGMDRDYGGEDNAWTGAPGDYVEYAFDAPRKIERLRLVFDSCLNRNYHNMPCLYRLEEPRYKLPETLIRDYEVVGLLKGEEIPLLRAADNRRRLVYHPIGRELDAIRVIPRRTWGAAACRIFAMDVE